MTNKITKIPQIRFNDFTGDWEQRKLKEYIIPYTEKTTLNNQYPVLTSSRKGLFLQTDYYKGNQIASDDNTGYNIVPRNYFTYRHMSDDEIFKFNINDLVDFGIVSTLYPVFTTNVEMDSIFLQYILNFGSEFSKFAIMQKQGGSRTYMYLSKLEKLQLTLPKFEEQQKIGSFFKQLDNTIALHQREYDLLKLIKQRYLKELFPKKEKKYPEFRFEDFTEPWEQHKIGDVFSERLERSGEGELISVTINSGVVKASELDRKDNSSNDKSNYKKVEVGDIAYNSMRMWQGASGYSDYAGILSPAYTVIIPKEDVNSKFFAYNFKRYDMIQIFKRNSQGLTSDTWNLKFPTLKSIKVLIPSIEEQKQIAVFFDRINDNISLHHQNLENLKQMKKSLLQKMFV